MRARRVVAAIALVILGLLLLSTVAGFLVDWLWFSSLGYFAVFRTIFLAKLLVFLAVFVATGVFLSASGLLALRSAPHPSPWLAANFPGLPDLVGRMVPRRAWRFLVLGAALLLALLTALGETDNWSVVLRFIAQTPYGRVDPVFGKDFGFYFFSLPAYLALLHWALGTLTLAALVAGAVYWVNGDISLASRPWHVSGRAIAHGSALLGLFFALKAWSYLLDRYLLLYGDNGVVIGAAYTDIHVRLPILWALIGLTIAAALASWANMRWRAFWLPGAAVAGFIGLVVLTAGIPAIFERLYVKPSELQLEAPYLADNIALTQEAYGLRQVAIKPFPAEQNLTAAALAADHDTVDNIRLWDWRPLMDTYAQLQEIRTYYKFRDVDIDRYRLGDRYQQVMLSARELDPTLLPSTAQTWVNLHLLFTHGNGVVMSPVTQKTPEGLPIFYEQDVPPVASGGPVVKQPRLYFGEGPQSYVIVKTGTPEFDYPKGSDNVYTTYDGTDGVRLGGIARRTLFAWYFGDSNILLSRYLTAESRILFRRNIKERVQKIAPFLRLDHDPYITVSDGRLFWIQDAYTTSRWFPYSQPVAQGGIDYIRNSVKIVIDAYDGTVDFYAVDPSDPVLATYQRIFPGFFKPLAAMPADLQRHIRYPEDLFLIQAEMYRAYHMSAPEVFYNREDLWQFPGATSATGEIETADGAKMAPYYMIMRLPEEARAEYFLMEPMVPNRRENMIAWLAAGCDPPDYGKLIVYEFPKEKQVYGPLQIEARINQNTEISQQISLWNQMGSRVIRGNVLIIPVGDSILYVSPLYLRASTGQLPELKRVIAAYDGRVAMARTLHEALAAIFAGAPLGPPATVTATTQAAPAGVSPDAARQALVHYQSAIAKLKAGDWSGFGAELDALRPLLENLSRQPAAH
jgi:uncharacterized membrane protein (UPF0182 family)